MKMVAAAAAAAAASAVCCGALTLVSGVRVHEVPLRRSDPGSPWCYAATAFVLDDEGEVGDAKQGEGEGSAAAAATCIFPNFLATQVWPSARAAAAVLKRHADPAWAVCELGCGPALPSLVAASKAGAARVVATDLDPFALKLARAAADAQGLENLSTLEFDLTSGTVDLPEADLYVMSDVFESAAVARGAAEQTVSALDAGRRVWVFAQSDRAQRESFREHLAELLSRPDIGWSTQVGMESKLWLYDVDETKVDYGS